MDPELGWVMLLHFYEEVKDWKWRLLTLKHDHSFSFFFSSSLYTSGGINEAHTHKPHAAFFVFKNILISLFHRELNAIDRAGPFKISTSIRISSSNTHTHTVSFPSGNDCPWVAGSWRGLFVCVWKCFLWHPVLHSLHSSILWINVYWFLSERVWTNAEHTFFDLYCLPIPLHLTPPPPLHSSAGRYLFVFEMH